MALICGIDEAGRGCVAGSLFLAGVILDECYFHAFMQLGIKDSKKLTYTQRVRIAATIQDFLSQHNGIAKIVNFQAQTIDNKGLSQCMRTGLNTLLAYAATHQCATIIFDGNTNFGIHGIQTLIKGDNKHPLIAAASILAKSSKDSEMLALHETYPQYNFKKNMGYLTKAHIACIAQYGYTAVHRKSYHIKALETRLF